MPEWLKGADCKSVDLFYVGSNPTRPKKLNLFQLFSFMINKKTFNITYFNFFLLIVFYICLEYETINK